MAAGAGLSGVVGFESDVLALQLDVHRLPLGEELLPDHNPLTQNLSARHDQLLFEQGDRHGAVRQHLDLARIVLAGGHALLRKLLESPRMLLADSTTLDLSPNADATDFLPTLLGARLFLVPDERRPVIVDGRGAA